MTNNLRIIIFETSSITARHLQEIISELPDVEISGIATTEKEIKSLIQTKKPHLIVCGFKINGTDCIELARTIKKEASEIKILITTTYGENWIIEKALKHKIEGLILKNKTNAKELHNALQNIRNGKKYYSPEIKTMLFDSGQQNQSIPYLTTREKEIVQLICEDLNNKEVGAKLNIEANTVETHKRNVFKKLNVNSKVGLVREAIRYGFYEL